MFKGETTMAITTRPNSKYLYVEFQYNGKTIVRSAKTQNKKIAEQFERKLRDDLIKDEELGLKKEIKLSDAFEKYKRKRKNDSCYFAIVSTIKYTKMVINYDKPLHQFSSGDIEKIADAAFEDGKAAWTVKHMMNAIRGMLKFSRKDGYKVQQVELPSIKTKKGKLRYLTHTEEHIILKHIDPRRDIKHLPPYKDRIPKMKKQMWDNYHLFLLLIDTGARFGEISKLEWKDIDLNKKCIHLYRSKTDNQSIIWMTDRVYETFLNRTRYKHETQRYVFENVDGSCRTRGGVSLIKAFKKCGLDDVTVHTLRHTCASRLVQNGCTLYEVKEILGHSDVRTTEIYAHLEQSSISKKAATILNDVNNFKSDHPQLKLVGKDDGVQ